jgi:hypothetical protein
VPWIVSTMGMHVSESLRGKYIEDNDETSRLIEKYSTGPTATLRMGDKKICSYIAHGQKEGVSGITFNPFYDGAVQACPYHSMINTSEWFNLKNYLNSLKNSAEEINSEKIGNWFDYALKIEELITKSAFEIVGYENCLMRHSRKPEIDLFIAKVNSEMTKIRKKENWNPSEENYFNIIVKKLEETTQNLILKNHNTH